MTAAARRDQPLSIALADIGHFHRVDDEFGHTAGDELLRRLATEWRTSLPEGAVERCDMPTPQHSRTAT